jgi:hypothetical protein
MWTFGPSGHDKKPRAHRQAPPDPTYGLATPVIHGITSSVNGKPPPTSCSSFATCCHSNHLGGATNTLRCKGGASKGRAAPPSRHPVATDLATPTSTPLSLYTINRRVWCMVEIIPSKFQAFQASSISLA